MMASPHKLLRFVKLTVCLAVVIGACFYKFVSPGKTLADEKSAAIEKALFARTEFFGAQAIVPLPTAEARARLAEVAARFPGDAEITLKLAELDEKLVLFDEAEAALKAVAPTDLAALAQFYGRRAAFEKQGEVLERILNDAPPEKRGEAFSTMIFFAKKHDLKKYLAPEFYRKIIAENEGAISVLFDYVEKLSEEKNYPEALQTLETGKAKFPALKSVFLEKQIAVLILQEKRAEAEKLYREAFDPLWSDDKSEKFYEFLRDGDRFRAYESEIEQSFRRAPDDFTAAMRLVHLRRSEGDYFGDVMQKLEKSRAQRKIAWQPEELLTAAQFLIEADDGDAASRFLYTLCADPRVREKGDLRRRVLYQIFELLSDAGYERLALTRGNLDFYETIAKSDARPGITTGILSLIFADAGTGAKFESKKQTAVKLFNRAAAFRVFEQFKTEYPQTPELAQMYLDIFRLYADSPTPEVAEKALEEFAAATENFEDYADAAMKLADAYIAAKNYEKERAVYQKLLDFRGKSGKPKFDGSFFGETGDPTQTKPRTLTYPPSSNTGINLAAPKKNNDYYYYDQPKTYTNFLRSGKNRITYADALARYVASLARENKTQEILDLYAAETAKYPQEEALYEQMLQWLGQTNLGKKQFEVYQNALRNFKTSAWRDRFARWLIRNRRNDEFAEFSRSTVATFDDAETRDYLKNFIEAKQSADPQSLDGAMYFGLYSLAHRRFPRNLDFVKGLLRFYKQHKMETEWRALLAEYYFESPEIRAEFLTTLARTNELRAFLQKAETPAAQDNFAAIPYKLFRADAGVWLSDFENSVDYYRELNALYPNRSEFSENFLVVARSFGQTNRDLLFESAAFAQNQADHFPADENFRVRAGELQAELGDYARARENWLKIIEQAAGEKESYLNTATVFWDYFQFDDAIAAINVLRRQADNENLYAFQTGAILEAKGDKSAAIVEYLKALDETDAPDDRWRAKERLKQLYQTPSRAAEINAAFEKARKSAVNEFRLTFNFADAIFQMKPTNEAVKTVLRQVEREKSEDNLLEARQFFRDLNEPQAILKTNERLAATAANPRDRIAYRFQLAENYREAYEKNKSEKILAELLNLFPNNYGVLKEVETFYWDLGEREKSIAVLQSARGRARGRYFYQFSRKLAQRLMETNRLAEAENILLALQTDHPQDGDVFEELTDLYVKTKQSAKLRKTFNGVIEALKDQELEPREFKWRAADLRRKMIAAFTRLKDYDSAAEQYVEIINREPENEELLDEALSFAKRYGGAQKLLAYYRQVAAESFKNYRWNVVLARLYSANNDLANAAENYRTAIYNQPEMTELYESLGEIYPKTGEHEAALANVNKLLELAGEETKFVKQKAEILDKLGRTAEADAERAKLPAEQLPKPPTLPEQFAEAQNLRRTEAEKSIEKYHAAFENFAENPFQATIRQADISGYIDAAYGAEKLAAVTEKLWNLRAKFTAEITNPASVKSGRARENLRALDAAMLESISEIIKTKATGDEILAFQNNLAARLAAAKDADSQTAALLQNLITGCGLTDLEEKMLLENLENSTAETRSQNLRALVGFYEKRADFRRILEILEGDLANENLDLVKIYADTALFLNDAEKELAALRIIFSKQTTGDRFTKRFLEILHERTPAEIANLARTAPARSPEIINFLLAKKDFQMAQEAISLSPNPDLWKASRAAEASLNLRIFQAENETFFISALKPASIGELVGRSHDPETQLVGGDWFNLSEKYGRWLFAGDRRDQAELYLAARVEQNPNSADAQFDLGYFYLERQDYTRALEHFDLASELRDYDESFLPYIGAAHFRSGARDKALETWAKLIRGDDVTLQNASLYLKTLADFGQSEKARADLIPILLAQLTASNDSETSQTDDNLRSLIRELAKSFTDEDAKTRYFSELCRKATGDVFLPRLLIEESLVARPDFGVFYEILMTRGGSGGAYDYDFVSIYDEAAGAGEAEQIYDAENEFAIAEPENEDLERRLEYLDYLVENRDFARATRLAGEIENALEGRAARPLRLRLAAFRLLLEQGKTAEAFAGMLKFTGIELAPDAPKAALPEQKRFGQAVSVLKSANRDDLALALREAFYARRLALGQFDAASFSGLAHAGFEKGDSAAGLKILQILTESSAPERLAELDALPLIVKFADRQNLNFEPRNSINAAESLRLAAEMTTEFGFLDEAFSYREKLRAAAPFDGVNCIELARLAQKVKTNDEAAKLLSEVFADKNFERQTRWQSLLIFAEIASGDASLRQTAGNLFASADSEIKTVLQAFELFQSGQTTDAVKLLDENNFTPELRFLKAVFEKKAGFDEHALESFGELLELNDRLDEIFGFEESTPLVQKINLYLQTGQPRAALETAKKAGLLKKIASTEPPLPAAKDFQTLENKARTLKHSDLRRLLEKLSAAAETTGDLAAAIEYETARQNFDPTGAAAERLEILRQKAAQANAPAMPVYQVDGRYVSDF